MSVKHPIISITGSSGAGTSRASVALEHIVDQLDLKAAFIEGDAFHRFDREEMTTAISRARIRGENFSHFGPQANFLDKLENLFRSYGESGAGMTRRYLHNDEEASAAFQAVGTFTPWQPIPDKTDLLVYEGLHGGVVTDEFDLAAHVDLLVGVSPIVNLEWIQKLKRDAEERGHAPQDVTRTILRRMPDYVNYITPQFSRTDVNFQRVPLVDTANPFVLRDIPTQEESLVVIHFAPHSRIPQNFDLWLKEIPNSFMSRDDTLVVRGTQQTQALELIFLPAIEKLMTQRALMQEKPSNLTEL